MSYLDSSLVCLCLNGVYSLKAAMVLLFLLLQKSCCKSKAKEHSACLEGRLRVMVWFWKEEPFSIACPSITHLWPNNVSCSFANFVFAGTTEAHLDLISRAQKGTILHLVDQFDLNYPGPLTFLRMCIKRAPPGLMGSCGVHSPFRDVHPVIF